MRRCKLTDGDVHRFMFAHNMLPEENMCTIEIRFVPGVAENRFEVMKMFYPEGKRPAPSEFLENLKKEFVSYTPEEFSDYVEKVLDRFQYAIYMGPVPAFSDDKLPYRDFYQNEIYL